jgi:predicted RNase H-like HicB family nuclease
VEGKKNMTVPQKLTIVIERNDDWYTGWILELPGANTQGQTLDEVWANLKEAMTLILETRGK